MAEQILTTARDAFVNEAAGNQNYRGVAVLKLDNNGSDEKYAYIGFPHPTAGDPNVRIVSAMLRVYVKTAPSANITLRARRIEDAWGLERVTWNNKPDASATNQGTVAVTTGAAVNSAVDITVTDMMSDVVAGQPWYGIRLDMDPATAATFVLHSSEAEQRYRPVLIIDTSYAPDLPDNLQPDAQRAVDSSNPTLTWEFGSLNDMETQTAFRVQVDDATDFASAVYDSGWVTSALQKLDLAYNMLTANQSTIATNTTGWAAGANTAIARVTAAGTYNTQTTDTAGLSLTSAAAGDVSATTPTGASGEAVTVGETYTASALFKSAVSARSARMEIGWYTSGGALISTSTGSTITTSTSAWTRATLSAEAPATAAYAAVVLKVQSTGGASEVHYADDIQLSQSDGTEDGFRPAYDGLTNNTTYYWRVNTRDNDSLESGYSDTAEFQRRTYGTLAITSPAADNDDVDDNTPTIVHTFSNRTQTLTKYELKYRNPDNNNEYDTIWTGDWQQSTATSFTIPEDVIHVTSGKYKVFVSVRDKYNREASDYVSTNRIFDYVPGDAGVTAPSSLTATTTAPNPYVTLAWTRAATPDGYVIERDGDIIDTVSGADVFVSGTSYQYIDYSCPPRTSVVYKVYAKTEGTGVSSAATASAVSTTPSGIWLIYGTAAYTDTDYKVRLLGQEQVASTFAEDGETFRALNRRDPIRIVSRLGGLEGSVSGLLMAENSGETFSTYLSHLRTIIGRYALSEECRLVFGSRNIPVVVGNFELRERPTSDGQRQAFEVSFNYWQVAEFEVEVPE